MTSRDPIAHSTSRSGAVQTVNEPVYPTATPALAEQRTRLAPGRADAFRTFGRRVFADGATPAKTHGMGADHDPHASAIG